MASKNAPHNALEVIGGPRTIDGTEQYLISWKKINRHGQRWADQWLDAEDIEDSDILIYREAHIVPREESEETMSGPAMPEPGQTSFGSEDARAEDVSDKFQNAALTPPLTGPSESEVPTQHLLSEPATDSELPLNLGCSNENTNQARHPEVAASNPSCQDKHQRFDLDRTAPHNQQTRLCQSGRHALPYHICRGCEAFRLYECCTAKTLKHIYHDEGCHTICSTCAKDQVQGLFSSRDEFIYACTCGETGGYLCVQCHMEIMTERTDLKDDSTRCFCGRKVDQTSARRCSGCHKLIVKPTWNEWTDMGEFYLAAMTL